MPFELGRRTVGVLVAVVIAAIGGFAAFQVWSPDGGPPQLQPVLDASDCEAARERLHAHVVSYVDYAENRPVEDVLAVWNQADAPLVAQLRDDVRQGLAHGRELGCETTSLQATMFLGADSPLLDDGSVSSRLLAARFRPGPKPGLGQLTASIPAAVGAQESVHNNMGTYADDVGELRHEVYPPGMLERVQITTVSADQNSYCIGMTTEGLPTVFVRGPEESLSGRPVEADDASC